MFINLLLNYSGLSCVKFGIRANFFPTSFQEISSQTENPKNKKKKIHSVIYNATNINPPSYLLPPSTRFQAKNLHLSLCFYTTTWPKIFKTKPPSTIQKQPQNQKNKNPLMQRWPISQPWLQAATNLVSAPPSKPTPSTTHPTKTPLTSTLTEQACAPPSSRYQASISHLRATTPPPPRTLLLGSSVGVMQYSLILFS